MDKKKLIVFLISCFLLEEKNYFLIFAWRKNAEDVGTERSWGLILGHVVLPESSKITLSSWSLR